MSLCPASGVPQVACIFTISHCAPQVAGMITHCVPQVAGILSITHCGPQVAGLLPRDGDAVKKQRSRRERPPEAEGVSPGDEAEAGQGTCCTTATLRSIQRDVGVKHKPAAPDSRCT